MIDKHLYGDQWKSAHSHQGYRALITNNDNSVSTYKRSAMLAWATALETMAREAEEAGETHVRSLYYVGYAIDAVEREKDRLKTDHASNWLIRFAQAVLNLAPWCPEEVNVFTHPICMLAGEPTAAVAEALLARALCSYHFHGGFNIQPCGASTASIYRKDWTQEQRERYWASNRQWLVDEAKFDEYVKTETERREKLQEREWLLEEKKLMNERQSQTERKDALISEAHKIHKDMDFEMAKKYDFLQEYAGMFEHLSKTAGEMGKPESDSQGAGQRAL